MSPQYSLRRRWLYQSTHLAVAMGKVSELLGVGQETLRKWVRQGEVDQGARPGVTSEESAEMKRLKRENAELKRANAILKAASAFFAAELDRPGQ